ncbi:exported hypothetical protein [Flavobacterium sp. 9AF]|uniref:T9SS type A sorting domain-containing protein n=1 Tax=Flavobacterium sp. 9AF TaxID=2653142 RepID=UPI0012F14AB5|nr:T9SS type A sorting domain-containing protein [Flavobacterium sp. 9AF]VXC42558.1 exported hypothetical protein [Flavobacterium sp. 9AF]
MKNKVLAFIFLLCFTFTIAQCPSGSVWNVNSNTSIGTPNGSCNSHTSINVNPIVQSGNVSLLFTDGNFSNYATITNLNNGYIGIGNNVFINNYTYIDSGTSGGITTNLSSAFRNKGDYYNNGYLFVETTGEFKNEDVFTNSGIIVINGIFSNQPADPTNIFQNESNTSAIVYGNNNGIFNNYATFLNKENSIFDFMILNYTNSVLLNSGTFKIKRNSTNSGDITTTSPGVFEIYNNAVFDNNAIFTTNGQLIIQPNSSFVNIGNFTINYSTTNLGLINNGGGTTVITDLLENTGSFYNYANLTNSNGTILNTGNFNKYLGSVFTNNGIFTNNGHFSDEDGSTLYNNGTWKGSNLSHNGTFFNDGILSPGNAVGTYQFNNNYIHQNTATAIIEVETTTNYDQVTSSNQIIINGGTLNIEFINGFTPNAGDSYTIMTATNGITGTFSTVNFPNAYASFMTITYTPNSVIVNVSPTLNIALFSKEEILVFPNPTKDYFELKLPKNTVLKSLDLFDMNGKLVKTFTSFSRPFNIQDLSKGTYNIILKTENEHFKLKIIK